MAKLTADFTNDLLVYQQKLKALKLLKSQIF